MEDHGGAAGFISTFKKPDDIENKIAADAYRKETANIDYNREDESIDKQLKKYWMGFYVKNGTGPGDDKLEAQSKKLFGVKRNVKADLKLKKVAGKKVLDKNQQQNKEVLDDIADMIHNAKFSKQLKGSTVAEIDKKVQNFLAF